MFIKSVLLSPEMAKELLSRNNKNRPVKEDRVNVLARDILAGNWKQTGETVKIGLAGNLLDGQHRLAAIVKANGSVNVMIAYDVDDSAIDYIDTGVSRSASDVLSIGGHNNAGVMASGLRQLVVYERGLFSGEGRGGSKSGRLVTNHEVVDALNRHPHFIDAVQTYNRLAKAAKGGSGLMIGPSLGSFFIYQFSKQDQEKATEFFMGLAGQMAFDADSPVFKLRERLIANRVANAKLASRTIAAIVIKSWNLFKEGKKAKERLHFRVGEEFPKF